MLVGVIVLLFGAKKLPQLAQSLGRAKGEFRKALEENGSERDEPESGDEGAPPTPDSAQGRIAKRRYRSPASR